MDAMSEAVFGVFLFSVDFATKTTGNLKQTALLLSTIPKIQETKGDTQLEATKWCF
jgi:hypothetical protein